MEWILVITLFSSSDILLQEHSSRKECIKELKEFQKTHKEDTDVRSVSCEQAFVVDGEVLVVKKL